MSSENESSGTWPIAVQEARELLLQHGVWFVDIPRTSSTSIRAELAEVYGKPFGKTGVLDPLVASPQYIPDHLPAAVVRRELGADLWRKLYTFSIVRNPWDRILSSYKYRRLKRNIPDDWAFGDYIEALGDAGGEYEPYFRYYGHYLSACNYLLDDTGELLVTYVAHYESRERDLREVADRLGLASLGNRFDTQGTGSRRADRAYRSYYTLATRRRVADLYGDDIERFDYGF